MSQLRNIISLKLTNLFISTVNSHDWFSCSDYIINLDVFITPKKIHPKYNDNKIPNLWKIVELETKHCLYGLQQVISRHQSYGCELYHRHVWFTKLLHNSHSRIQ